MSDSHPVVMAKIWRSLRLATRSIVPMWDFPEQYMMACEAWVRAIGEPQRRDRRRSMPHDTARDTSTDWYFTLRANIVKSNTRWRVPVPKQNVDHFSEHLKTEQTLDVESMLV